MGKQLESQTQGKVISEWVSTSGHSTNGAMVAPASALNAWEFNTSLGDLRDAAVR